MYLTHQQLRLAHRATANIVAVFTVIGVCDASSCRSGRRHVGTAARAPAAVACGLLSLVNALGTSINVTEKRWTVEIIR
jgi:hypothetical protein